MKPRIDRAAGELTNAMKSLQSGETFSIVAFSHAARRFTKQLVPAEPNSIAQANQWLDRMPLDYGTDLEKALRQAFSMRGVNVVVLITDGVPTVGEKNFGKLISHIRELNISHARIDTIGLQGDNVDPDDPSPDKVAKAHQEDLEATDLLRQIARDSGGGFKAVDN